MARRIGSINSGQSVQLKVHATPHTIGCISSEADARHDDSSKVPDRHIHPSIPRFLGCDISITQTGAAVPFTVIETPRRNRPTQKAASWVADAWIATATSVMIAEVRILERRPYLSQRLPAKSPPATEPAFMMATLRPRRLSSRLKFMNVLAFCV